jgi:hypothetical protein
MYQLRNKLREGIILLISVAMCMQAFAQKISKTTTQAKPTTLYKNVTYQQLVTAFKRPPDSAKPWVFWYWQYLKKASLQTLKQ